MAEERKIIIEIMGSGSQKKKEKTEEELEAEANKQMQNALDKIFHPLSTLETATVGKNVIVNQAYQQAKQQVIRAADFYHSRYFSLKEDYIAETTYSNVKTAISKATGLLGAVGAGAVAGSKLGGYGAIAGALVGLAGFGINEYISSVQAKQSYYQELNTIGYETAYAQMRAGLIDNGKGTEN